LRLIDLSQTNTKDDARRIAANVACRSFYGSSGATHNYEFVGRAIEHQVIHVTFERATVG
jgi:hypothetical protein